MITSADTRGETSLLTPVMEFRSVGKRFGNTTVLSDIDLTLHRGQVLCLLGDNGAGKSTLIKIMSGVHAPTVGEVLVDGQRVDFKSPREAQRFGISAVHQDSDMQPLMSIWQNFFLGHELTVGRGLFRRIDRRAMSRIALEQIDHMGIRRATDANQLVGTMSGGECQALAICRALYFDTRILILDEPTSALGVKEAAIVLRSIEQAKAGGVAIIFITHNANHALRIGDDFVVLIQGKMAARFQRGERSHVELLDLMAGGEEGLHDGES